MLFMLGNLVAISTQQAFKWILMNSLILAINTCCSQWLAPCRQALKIGVLTGCGLLAVAAQAAGVEIRVNDPDGQPLPGMVVYLEPLENQILVKTTSTRMIDQSNKAFSPYIAVIQTGDTVRFRNQDDITHHIYSVATKNKFSFKIRAKQQHSEATFLHSGEVAMGCNIHDWMGGYLLIVDTPYFAKTNARGRALIEVAEPGRYRLTVWHPQMNSADNRISLPLLLPSAKPVSVVLSRPMAAIPKQKSDDDFDFLSDY